jgi:ribonuclease-3
MSRGEGLPVPKRREFEDLERRLGHRFADTELLRRALTHRSFANETPEALPHNETLEFLGDAVLEFVVRDLLFHLHPQLDEGRMTQIKVRLVNAVNLARHAEELRLGEALFLGRGEEKGRGRLKSSLIADAFEAVVAAIYLDGGLRAARCFLSRRFRLQIESAATTAADARDHKSALQEWLQARGLPLPVYEVTAEGGPDHAKTFTVAVRLQGAIVASATGRSKKEAQQLAAAAALAESSGS